MKALFISNWDPRNNMSFEGGMYKRLILLISSLKNICSEIDSLFFVPEPVERSDEASLSALLSDKWKIKVNVSLCQRSYENHNDGFIKKHIKGNINYFKLDGYAEYSTATQKDALEDRLKQNPSLILVQRLPCMIPLIKSDVGNIPIIFDIDDIEHIKLVRNTLTPPIWAGKFLDLLKLPALLWGENRSIKISRTTLVCSSLDQRKIERLFFKNNVLAIPNAVSKPISIAPSKSRTLLMVGAYWYPPNKTGAEFFINNVWPLVLNEVPDAKLVFAGAKPELITPKPGAKLNNIEFLGFVDRIEDAYSMARAVICPILTGGGTRVKIMEAAAYGLPIVSTTIGAEGIELHNNKEILLRDSPSRFSSACIRLLKNNTYAESIGKNARNTMIEKYSGDEIILKLTSHIKKITHSNHRLC